MTPAPISLMGITAAAAALAAGALAGGVVLLLRAVSRHRARRVRVPSRIAVRIAGPQGPLWLRGLLPAARWLSAPLGPRLPPLVRQRVLTALRGAELDDALAPEEWLGVAAIVSVAGGAVAAALPAAPLLQGLLCACAVALPWLWLRDARRRREWQVLRDLPAYVDMLTLALEAGGALSVALAATTARAPDSPLRRAFMRLQLDLRAGRTRIEALRSLDGRIGMASFTAFVAALIQAESSGSSLAAALRAQAEQRLNERFARAEKLALEAPVKMLVPLIFCIFPCTFIVLGFPVALRLMQGH